jgi:hypothetical protein
MGSSAFAAAFHNKGRRPSARAHALTRRSYNRALDDAGTKFETYPMTTDRVIGHQRWLWERAQGDSLTAHQEAELEELRDFFLARVTAPAGRTLWLGGTEIVKRREASNFNCAFLEVRTVHDLVDAFWLLLQGCGVGFKPITGTLSGFTRKMEVQFIRSTHKIGDPKDQENNTETYDPNTRTWTIKIGDSAEAWAKSVGKLVAGKFPAKKLIIDTSPIRAPGTRLKGYGWICNGDRGLRRRPGGHLRHLQPVRRQAPDQEGHLAHHQLARHGPEQPAFGTDRAHRLRRQRVVRHCYHEAARLRQGRAVVPDTVKQLAALLRKAHQATAERFVRDDDL